MRYLLFILFLCYLFLYLFFFFFNDTATTEIYTLSLHDALPISPNRTTEYHGVTFADKCPVSVVCKVPVPGAPSSHNSISTFVVPLTSDGQNTSRYTVPGPSIVNGPSVRTTVPVALVVAEIDWLEVTCASATLMVSRSTPRPRIVMVLSLRCRWLFRRGSGLLLCVRFHACGLCFVVVPRPHGTERVKNAVIDTAELDEVPVVGAPRC